MNIFGHNFRLAIWGESHGPQIGISIDGVPAGIPLSAEDFEADLARRRSGARGTTPRREPDIPQIVSGLYNGMTTGAPLTIEFANTDTHSQDYATVARHYRPSHADLVAYHRFNGVNDPRGGGPFWVTGADGLETLQIAESNQIAPEKRELMRLATHFNPVDLVCSFRTSKGGRFDLQEFVDPATGFISRKSDGGRELLAQELPGLWNGAMARWNTVFVEVPITTFSPVKVVTDLLRPEHQGDEF